MKKEYNEKNLIIQYGDFSEKVLKILNYKENKKIIENNNVSFNENNLENALSEVYDIIMHSDDDIKSKIPSKFIKFLDKNRNRNYQVNINYNISLNSQKLLRKTKYILAIIYKNYLVGDKEKIKLIKEEEKKLNDIYEIKWKKDKIVNQNNNKMQLIEVKKQTWLQKLVNLFRKGRLV